MKRILIPSSLIALASLAHAEQFLAVSTSGGPIPAVGAGGGGTYPTLLPPHPAVSQITLTHEVGTIYAVIIDGLQYDSAGDLQAVLRDPAGVGHNIFVRSGFNGSVSNTGDFTGGSYNFSNFGNGNGAAFPGTLGVDIPGGQYQQDFGNSGAPPAPWPDGSAGVFNVPLNSIHSSLAGTWSLEIYDWDNEIVGSFTGWKLSGERPSIAPFCFGDGTQAVACPCNNSGSIGHGCQNSLGTGGSLLTAAGVFTPDSIVLTATGETNTALSIFIQGSLGNPLVFGDGLRCFSGTTKRLYVKNAAGGTVVAPALGDPSITARSAALGFPIPHAAGLVYQVFYRDANPNFCTAAQGGSTFNISNALRIVWP
jgi:hypothetical protein